MTDLRKPKVYAGLIEGQKTDLICALSSLNEPHRDILSFSLKSGELSRTSSDPTYTNNFVISKTAVPSTMPCT